MINKFLRLSIRKLSDLGPELLRAGRQDFYSEIQQMIVRLLEIQDQFTQKEGE